MNSKERKKLEKIKAEVEAFVKKYGKKNLKIDMNKEFDEETDEMIKEWNLKKKSASEIKANNKKIRARVNRLIREQKQKMKHNQNP